MLIMQLLNTYLTRLCLAAFHLVYIILFCIRAWVVYGYGACIFTVIYLATWLPAFADHARSGLVNVELKSKIRERSERKNLMA